MRSLLLLCILQGGRIVLGSVFARKGVELPDDIRGSQFRGVETGRHLVCLKSRHLHKGAEGLKRSEPGLHLWQVVCHVLIVHLGELVGRLLLTGECARKLLGSHLIRQRPLLVPLHQLKVSQHFLEVQLLLEGLLFSSQGSGIVGLRRTHGLFLLPFCGVTAQIIPCIFPPIKQAHAQAPFVLPSSQYPVDARSVNQSTSTAPLSLS